MTEERKIGKETIREAWYTTEAIILFAVYAALMVYGFLMWFRVI